MDILLIQPPDAPPVVEPRDISGAPSRRFVPSWDLQCLRSFILNRTRFSCELVDARFFHDIERQLEQKIQSTTNLHLVVVETTSLNIGPASAVIDLVRRTDPELRIAVCGPHPSQFPDRSDAPPGADFAFCGDPEPILRNVMESIGMENRLPRVPGLRIAGHPPAKPYWLPDLKSLCVPDWTGVDWAGYTRPLPRQGAVAEIRLSRGHTKSAADRSHGGAGEPLRVWPLDRVAAVLEKCGSAGIVEVHVGDAPGFWTDARLATWCAELERARSTQPWSFQMQPRTLTPEMIRDLAFVCCRRIEMIFPSASAEILARYGCESDFKKISRTIVALQSAGIEVEARAWVGGPEETKGEADRLLRMLRRLRFPPLSLRAFPLSFDAPVYQEIEAPGKPSIESWIKWARDPWIEEKPLALWGDEKARAYIESVMTRIERAIRRDPHHKLLRIVDMIRDTKLIEWVEDFSVSLLRKTPGPP